MLSGKQPILILKEGTEREQGRDAQHNNIRAAMAIADAVRSTLGPKGMDKMLVDSMGDVVITNDGVTILKEIDIEHPAAKMIVEVAKTQDEECGDGTTSAVIIAGELLKKALDLIEQDVHPTVIADGYRIASKKACEILESIAEDVKPDDAEVLKEIAATSMTGKAAAANKELLSDIAYRAVKAVSDEENGKITVDLDNVKIEKKHGGSVEDTELIEGIVLDKERVHPGMPKVVKDAKIMLLNTALEVKKTEVDAQIRISDPTQLQKFLDEEEAMLRKMVDKIKASGANVVLCQKGIDDLAQHYLSKAGIFAVRRVKKSDMEKLARATGASIVSELDEVEDSDLGYAGKVEEKKIGDDEMVFVTNCKEAKAVTILIRGGTEHVVDEIERGMHDALSVVAATLEDGKITTGGGSAATEISLALRDFASSVGGREQMAVEAFADAIEVIPKTLATNAGLDAIDMLIELKKAHKEGKKTYGVDIFAGKPGDMRSKNVVEPMRVGTQAIKSATETTVMILRIDDVIAAKGSSGGGSGGGAGGGMGGGMPEY
ncbi:MAG: thermosome subunit [Thermoplasmata archaeon]|nr:TCP-1/cpn60 chaperonin family protein [Thermoplasmata archaeon]RLF43555.1 MAG: thermosome subunit [Thermoplasmata archaeon]RLF49674.1 MAG: thermosome subunit [Thermoplasmata archaeon]